ncbi:MAG: DUF350 domain-containing protein [Rhizobiales bacterium]|nr:DUF350 domain-containing protein [Hyphomicrobiales bacterium]
MEFLNTYFGLSSYYLLVLGVNLVITALVLIAIRFVIGMISNVKMIDGLSLENNPAMGISLAGIIFAVGIIMTGVIGGEASDNLIKEIVSVSVSGIIGIILVFSSRVIFDKISIPKFKMRDAIMQGNIAVSVVDAGNVIASALIIKSVFLVIDTTTTNLIIIGLGSFIVSQLLLTIASYYRIFFYNRAHGRSLQDNIIKGNIALALRFAGFRIGMAFAISGALTLAPLSMDILAWSLLIWLGVSLVQMLLVIVFSFICDKVLLMGIDTRDEVDNKQNIAVGATQAALTSAIGLIIFTLVS